MSMQFDGLNHSGFSKERVLKTAAKLSVYKRHLKIVARDAEYSRPEGSLCLPSDQAILAQVQAVVKKKRTKKLKYVVVIGIGGSNLGTQSVYEAQRGKDGRFDEKFPQLLFVDTVDAIALVRVTSFLSKTIQDEGELLLLVISKSGGTTETIANAEYLLAALGRKFHAIGNRVIAITDQNSRLWEKAGERGMSRVSLPHKVGGRYSVLSAVGLLPLSLIGYDVIALLKGAESMRDKCLEAADRTNPATLSAAVLYLHAKAGRRIHDTFFFNPELESLGKWYRQLLAESIGKEALGKTGTTRQTGITPTVSIGSTDLHSVGQLYLGGPDDRVTTFITTTPMSSLHRAGKAPFFDGLVEGVVGKNPSEIMAAIQRGTAVAYKKKNLPFMSAVLDDLSPFSLGAFMQWKMLEVMFLGKLLGVDAFDQPNVELYKQETRRLLRKSVNRASVVANRKLRDSSTTTLE